MRSSQERDAHARSVFNLIDIDGDGSIDAAEFEVGMRRLGLELSADEVAVAMAQADTDRDGTISFDEFVLALSSASEEAGAALSAGDEETKTRICSLLRGEAPAREDAYRAIEDVALKTPPGGSSFHRLSQRSWAVELLTAVLPSLGEVLCSAARGLGVKEFRRATLVLRDIVHVDCLSLAAPAYMLITAVILTEENVPGLIRQKPAAELDREDALTLAYLWGTLVPFFALGIGDCCVEADIDELAIVAAFKKLQQLFPERMIILWAGLLAEPNLPNFAAAGAWQAIHSHCVGNAEVGRALVEEHCILELAMRTFKKASPAEWVTLSSRAQDTNFIYSATMHSAKECWESAQTAGVDVTGLLLESGLFRVIIDSLKAFEATGATRCNRLGNPSDINQAFITLALWGLAMLDYEHSAGGTAMLAALRQIPQVVCFALDHEVRWANKVGLSSASFAAFLAGSVFGKDESSEEEDGGMLKLNTRHVELLVETSTQLLRCTTWGGILTLTQTTGRGVCCTCISDINKQLLLGVTGFLEHLIDGLLLDSSHPRVTGDFAGTKESRAAVQRDFAHAIEQLALFPLGAAALCVFNGMQDTMQALVECAWTEEAKKCARTTLAVLWPPDKPSDNGKVAVTQGRGPHIMVSHIMISYQWDVQETVKRIVQELQRRQYTVWFDLNDMKGSTMDAMVRSQIL